MERSLRDLFPTSSGKVPWVELSLAIIATAFVYLVLQYRVRSKEDEQPVHVTVPVPEQCKPGWEGKVLERPSVKVGSLD